jgi:hypothetical protein
MHQKILPGDTVTDKDACAVIRPTFPVPCSRHRNSVVVREDAHGAYVLCECCYDENFETAIVGAGFTREDAIADWNEAVAS